MENIFVPSGQQIPNLQEKISFLLRELGCNQQWLAGELGVTSGRIAQIKKEGIIPQARFKRFCHVLCITTQEMEMMDMEAFKKQVRESFDKNRDQG